MQKLPTQVVLGFLRVLEDVRREELSCEEIFNKLDEYVECEVDNRRRPDHAFDP